MTNVLCVIRHPVGGIATYMRYVYGRLDRGRFRVTVLAASGAEGEAVFPGLGFAVCKFVPLEGRFGLLRLAAAVIRSFTGGGIELVHSQGATAGAIVALINHLWRKPHVITFHETFHGATLPGKLAALRRWLLSYLFSRASRINVVSDDARQNMLDYFPTLRRYQGRIVVIPNGVDVRYLAASEHGGRDLRGELGISSGRIALGYLGRFMPEKGFPVLIEAMAELVRRGRRDVVVVAVGSGAYEREYRELVRSKGLEAHFRFLEYQKDVRWILHQLDVLAIPSLREAYPLVAIEGLVLGCSIAASDCIGLREVLAGSPAVMVAPGDPGALADGIERAVDPRQRERARQYRAEAQDRFDVGATANRLSALFEQVLSPTA